MTTVTYKRDLAGERRLLTSPTGPIGQDLHRRVFRVRLESIRRAPVGKNVPADAWSPGHRAGGLRGSITSEIIGGPLGLVGKVRATKPYAMAVHEGSRSHDIPNESGGKLLRWRKPETGYVTETFTPRVHHPGTRPQPFLRDSLPAARG